jgi:hypothetical protein
MTICTHFSHAALIFNKKELPEPATVVGYAAIINSLRLPMPYPYRIAIISNKNRKYQDKNWNIYPNSYFPKDSIDISAIEALYHHLVFALKYEGVNLLLFKKISGHFDIHQLNKLVNIEPTGQYSRRIWFLLEWLTGLKLDSDNLSKKNYVHLVDSRIQYTIDGEKSARHLIINNLLGTIDFCPLIYRSPKLENYIATQLYKQENTAFSHIAQDILQRAASFLMLEDSKASFAIEGENPRDQRVARWSKAIGQAGFNALTKEELIRLQTLVIENSRFIDFGYRQKGGFIGEHDPNSGLPMPAHISAKWQDLDRLMNGLLQTKNILLNSDIDAVLVAAIIAFGFVFIHPFQDGNGRIHRYLIHHILAKKQFSPPNIIFPISAAILNNLHKYRLVLESYSLPLLDFIDWRETQDHNINVSHETIDFYRYFDATPQAEFLYDCVHDTIKNIMPNEIDYLQKYDQFKNIMAAQYAMPEKLIAILVIFLRQNKGKLSKRAREKEFSALTDIEIDAIEAIFYDIFLAI